MLRCVTLVACGVALALSSPARTQERPPSNGDELRRLDATLDLARRQKAQDYAISTPNGIDEAKYLKVGGIERWVTLRGEDRANPVVLVLHGGPRDATNPWGYAGFRAWLKTDTVVQWDQRGAGRPLGRNGRASAATLTIDRLVQDGVELADAIRTALRKDKIILLGHSWGSVLGVLMAKAKTISPRPPASPRALVDGVDAPRKAFAIEGGHFAVSMNPSQFVPEGVITRGR